ncbi:TonB-dependent receptor [Lysobacter sp. CA199]|uniref:TonB-dependent receptor n=1 Tax=Lysobacter sp. CA199 TaxID=3455608 RepID=UPI003F8D5C9A
MKLRPRMLSLRLRQILLSGLTVGVAPFAFAASPQEPATATERDDAATLDTVKVTAQSRQQELKDVPIAVQVVNDDMIDKLAATDLSQISSFVPGLYVDGDQKTQPGFTLRGIYTDDFGIGTDPAVGIYIDGVYAGRSGGSMLAFNDVERVEVLKGPQGTLFGRNSAAGAISVISKMPSHDLEGNARVRIGNYGKRYFDGMLNLPTGEYGALRFNVLSNKSDGWLRDQASGERYNDDNDFAFRSAFRGQIGENTFVWLSWDHEKLDTAGAATIGLVPQAPQTLPPSRPPVPPDPLSFLDPRKRVLHNDGIGHGESRDFDGVTLNVSHNFDWGNLTSITAWRAFQSANLRDDDGTDRITTYLETGNREDESSWYQEFKFSGTTEHLDWVAGASYYSADTRQANEANTFTDSIDTILLNAGALPPDFSNGLFFSVDQLLQANGVPATLLGLPWQEAYLNTMKSKSMGVFGDVIWHVGDKLNLTFGLRYTRDEKEFSWFNGPRNAAELDATLAQLDAMGVFADFGGSAALFPQNVIFDLGSLENQKIATKNTWDDWSPRLVVDYHFNDQVMAFASLAKGYKAGGYNATAVNSRFDNENIWNLEAGIKTSFPDQHLAFNASLFTYRYDNRQAVRVVQDPGSSFPRVAIDTSDQEAWGLDMDARWRPLQGLTLDANASFIDSTYKNYLTPLGLDLGGKPTGEPFWSFAGGINYVLGLGDGGDLEFSLRESYRGKRRCNDDARARFLCLSNAAFDPAKAQWRTDARIAWNSADNHWSVAVYGNNLLNDRYVADVRDFTSDVFGTPAAVLNTPRMYGLELRASF